MTADKVTLETREGLISQALDAAKEHFAVIGLQLQLIRDERLYPDETFEAYCERRWDFSRGHAYRLMTAAEVAGNLSPAGDIPKTERQAREVASASDDPGVQREVWEKAKEIGETDQPSGPTIAAAAQIVQTGQPANHESIEIDAAIAQLERLQKKLVEAGKRVQLAFEAKAKVSRDMQSRSVKFRKKVDNLASRVDLLREDVEDLATDWARTKKQIDD